MINLIKNKNLFNTKTKKMDCWDVNNNLTKELYDLQEKYETILKNSLKYTIPRIKVYSVNDFMRYQDNLTDFIEEINILLGDLKTKKSCSDLLESILVVKDDHEIIQQIIDNLNKLTRYQNKVWCETRVNNALKTIIPLLNVLSEYLDFDTETTLDTEELYKIIIETFTKSIINFEDDVDNHLHSIAYYICLRCKEESFYLSIGKNILLCSDCTDNYKINITKCAQVVHTDNPIRIEPEPESELYM